MTPDARASEPPAPLLPPATSWPADWVVSVASSSSARSALSSAPVPMRTVPWLTPGPGKPRSMRACSPLLRRTKAPVLSAWMTPGDTVAMLPVARSALPAAMSMLSRAERISSGSFNSVPALFSTRTWSAEVVICTPAAVSVRRPPSKTLAFNWDNESALTCRKLAGTSVRPTASTTAMRCACTSICAVRAAVLPSVVPGLVRNVPFKDRRVASASNARPASHGAAGVATRSRSALSANRAAPDSV